MLLLLFAVELVLFVVGFGEVGCDEDDELLTLLPTTLNGNEVRAIRPDELLLLLVLLLLLLVVVVVLCARLAAVAKVVVVAVVPPSEFGVSTNELDSNVLTPPPDDDDNAFPVDGDGVRYVALLAFKPWLTAKLLLEVISFVFEPRRPSALHLRHRNSGFTVELGDWRKVSSAWRRT